MNNPLRAVLGVVDTNDTCQVNTRGIRSIFQALPIGTASSVLSLNTNLVATLLVGYKAWYDTSIKHYIRCSKY